MHIPCSGIAGGETLVNCCAQTHGKKRKCNVLPEIKEINEREQAATSLPAPGISATSSNIQTAALALWHSKPHAIIPTSLPRPRTSPPLPAPAPAAREKIRSFIALTLVTTTPISMDFHDNNLTSITWCYSPLQRQK